MMLRLRREAMTWLRARDMDSARGYWSDRKRYPEGIYVADAERRLDRLSEAQQPPPAFAPVKFKDVPPPIPGEPHALAALPASPVPPARLIAPPPALFANFGLPLPSLPGTGKGDSAFPPVRALPPPGGDEERAAAAENKPPTPVRKRRPVAPVARPAAPPASASRPATGFGLGPPTVLAPPQAPVHRAPVQRRTAPAPRPAAPVPRCTVENGQTVCR
jgi:hypothetical protein